MAGEILDGRVLAAQRAGRVAFHVDPVERRRKRVVDQQRTGQALADAEQLLQGLGRLNRADHAGQRAQNPGLLASWDEVGRRRLGEDAAITWVVSLKPGLEGGNLTLEAQQGAGYERPPGQVAGVVQQISGIEIVTAVGDQVVVLDDLPRVFLRKPRLVGNQAHLGVDLGHGLLGAQDLGHADARGRVDDLALQVGELDHVVVDDAQGADPGGRQVHQKGRAESAGADHQDLGGEQLRLALFTDLVEDDVPGVAKQLLVVELHAPVPDRHRPSNNGVERSRSAKDGRTTTTSLPAISGLAPTSRAAASAAPEETPTGRPSIRAALRAVA